ncbi:60S ribosomal protein L6 [Orobanche hederae]
MASTVGASLQSSYLRCPFLGDINGIRVSAICTPRVGVVRKIAVCKESRIGKQPIAVPSGVTLTTEGQDIKVKGPLGELAMTYPREIVLEKEESGYLRVRKTVETRRANQMHGLFRQKAHHDSSSYCLRRKMQGEVRVRERTLTDNMVVGVSKGFEKRLELVGTGYRAAVEGKDIVLNLGFSHPVRMTIPDGLQVKVEENTRIAVSGYDKSAIGQFAASIRKWRPPEPYKGKGVRYADEIVRRKEGKAGKKK